MLRFLQRYFLILFNSMLYNIEFNDVIVINLQFGFQNNVRFLLSSLSSVSRYFRLLLFEIFTSLVDMAIACHV